GERAGECFGRARTDDDLRTARRGCFGNRPAQARGASPDHHDLLGKRLLAGHLRIVFPPLTAPNRYAERMPNIGTGEIILLLLLALLLFGAKRLPEIGRSLGRGMREFKDSVSGMSGKDDDERAELPVSTPDTTSTAPRERDTVP
ncbi:MAG: sec-independent protein translocase protein TatA, partial [Gaiellaceae bacterium]|nr:sec-independent protein translocase protein TatA [Gaiellaceae bacterium]